MTTDYDAIEEAADILANQAAGMRSTLEWLDRQWQQMQYLTSGLTIQAFDITTSAWLRHMNANVRVLEEVVAWMRRRVEHVKEVENSCTQSLARL